MTQTESAPIIEPTDIDYGRNRFESGKITSMKWETVKTHEGMPVYGVWRGTPITEEPGTKVAIIGGIHGDECAGSQVILDLPDTLEIERGEVIAVWGNPLAAMHHTRTTEELTDKDVQPNLNRLLRTDLEEAAQGYAAHRARLLMPILAECTGGIIDIHEYKNSLAPPLIIAADTPQNVRLVKAIGTGIMVRGFEQAERGGTDGFAYEVGIPGICVEVGEQSGRHQRDNVKYAQEAIKRFLTAAGLHDKKSGEDLEPFEEETLILETDPSLTYKRTVEGDYTLANENLLRMPVVGPNEHLFALGEKVFRAPTHGTYVPVFVKSNELARDVPIGAELLSLTRVIRHIRNTANPR